MTTALRRRPAPPEAGRRRLPLGRAAARVPPALLAATTAVVALAKALGASPGPSVGVAVLLTGLLLGLPHGALDVDRVTAGRSRRTRLAVVVSYVAGVAAAFAAWSLWPAAVLGFLLVLAVAHFGASDLAEVSLTATRPPVPVRVAMAVGYGGLPVVLPFALAPARTRPLLDLLTGDSAGPILAGARAALPLVGAAVVVAAGWAVVRGEPRPGIELAVLALAFATVPPLIAFGVWFAGWHALRQSAGLVREVAGGQRATRRAVGTLARRAVVPTAGALAVIAAFVATSGVDLPAADLALLLCVTVPHSVVSAYADAHTPFRRRLSLRGTG